MLKNNKRGFTLVELLAVIVILGVITLIAVTSVIPRMNSARKNAFLDDAKVYFKASDEIDLYNNNTTKCLDISEVNGEYVSKNDDSYSGALYVYPNGDTKLYLTNGKYYVITTGDVTADDILDSKPANFIASCTDNSKTYTITYDLDGGTLATANPTSYKFNTDTFKLNNPTKPGYRFIGWSSKNIINFNAAERSANGLTAKAAKNDISVKGTNTKKDAAYGLITSYEMVPIVSGKTYTLSSNKKLPLVYVQLNYMNSNNVQAKLTSIGSNTTSATFTIPNNYSSYKYAFLGINKECRNINLKFNIQLEEGSSSTDYQEYMAPTLDVKIYRGSTGNKKFIANWEAI